MDIFEADLAEHTLRYAFCFSGTKYFFAPFLRCSKSDYFDIKASFDYIDSHRPYFPESTKDGYVEYKSLIGLTSLALLPYHRCIFHAAAFQWKGYAWLFAAPSGTGKSTQLNMWRHYFSDEIAIINGDMPCLALRDDGSIWVHPSPWNGKERLKGKVSAPLGGIIYLRQAKENRITPMNISEAVLPVFRQFEVRPDSVDDIQNLALLVRQLLKKTPIWKLENLGDEYSARMTYDYLVKHMQEKDGT